VRRGCTRCCAGTQCARLLGVYEFAGDSESYLHRVTHWLASARDGDLLVCHPSASVVPDDAISAARQAEHHALSQPAFAQALEAAGVSVSRMSLVTPGGVAR